MIPLLILVLGLQSQQELESRIQQKQGEIDQLKAELNEQRQQVGQLRRVVDQQDQELRRPFCSAEIRFR
jgi:septal ring factor EnvC (AmiA/AmiB activator)